MQPHRNLMTSCASTQTYPVLCTRTPMCIMSRITSRHMDLPRPSLNTCSTWVSSNRHGAVGHPRFIWYPRKHLVTGAHAATIVHSTGRLYQTVIQYRTYMIFRNLFMVPPSFPKLTWFGPIIRSLSREATYTKRPLPRLLAFSSLSSMFRACLLGCVMRHKLFRDLLMKSPADYHSSMPTWMTYSWQARQKQSTKNIYGYFWTA